MKKDNDVFVTGCWNDWMCCKFEMHLKISPAKIRLLIWDQWVNWGFEVSQIITVINAAGIST